MSRRRRKQAHVNHERWLVSYADFITLLFAFFVVLYATSQMDNKKVVRMSAAIQGAFQELGVLTGSASGSTLRVEAAPPGASQLPIAAGPLVSAQSGPKEGGDGDGVDFKRLKEELEEALGAEINRHEIQMRVTPEGLVVSLRELGFFDSGSAKLLEEGQAPLGRIAHILNTKGFQIRVEGHTDTKPIHTAQFKSNWELSTARATEVVTLLVDRYGLDPKQISVAGYSQYRPVADNETEEGRKVNRRVDLVVVSRTGPASKDPLGQADPQAKRGE
ncbi:MAG: flagellar motor protein MotB [Terriglobales bacterium]